MTDASRKNPLGGIYIANLLKAHTVKTISLDQ